MSRTSIVDPEKANAAVSVLIQPPQQPVAADRRDTRHNNQPDNWATTEGDGGRVATLAGIAARRVRRLVADGRSEDDDPRGGNRRVTGAVNALDCGDGRGVAGAMTTTTMGGPGDDDVEAIGRFVRAGRL